MVFGGCRNLVDVHSAGKSPQSALDRSATNVSKTSPCPAIRVASTPRTTYGVGITGIAGPSGGSEAKPVGTVHIAVAGAGRHEHRKLFWPMERTLFKRFATQSALDLLRLFVLRS